MPQANFWKRPWEHRALLVLLGLQCIGICGVFPYYAWTEWPTLGLKIFAAGLALIALLTLYGIWTQARWTPWAVLFVISAKLTIDIFAWSTALDTTGTPFSIAVLIAMAILVIRIGEPPTEAMTRNHRAFYALIVFFPAWVTIGGLLLPRRIDDFLPFMVPPFHARFIAAMYLAGVILTVLSALGRTWGEVRVSTAMIGLWTGSLNAVSLLYLSAFDWTSTPTWFWWIAYFWFPLGALFISLNQRSLPVAPVQSPVHRAAPISLTVLGAIALTLSVLLLVLPHVMMAIWPWKIPVMLAQIYGGPFMAYGLGCLYAARQTSWTPMRIPVLAVLGFTLTALIVSVMHSALLPAENIATWVWFIALGSAAAALSFLVIAHERPRHARTEGAKP